jgi:hypothetical protein
MHVLHPFVEGPKPQTVCSRSELEEWEPAAPGSTTADRRNCLANSTLPQASPTVANVPTGCVGLRGVSTTLAYIRQGPVGRSRLVDRGLEAHVAAVDVGRGEVDHPAGFRGERRVLGA